MKKSNAAAVAAIAVASIAGFATISMSDASSSEIGGTGLSFAASPAPRGEPETTSVPDEVIKAVSDHGISMTQVATTAEQVSELEVPTSAKSADEVAHSNLGFPSDLVADTATLATVTTANYGTQLEADPSKPSRIAPAIDKRLTWVLTYDSAPMPLLGKAAAESPNEGPSTVESQVLVLVDPSNGEFLYSIGY
jgi:hypothetical protein